MFLAWLIAITLIPFTTFAATPSGTAADFQKIYSSSRTVGDLLQNVKAKIPQSDFNLLTEKSKGILGNPLPPAKFDGEQIQFTVEGNTVVFRVISGAQLQFALNNHILDFAKITDPAERYRAIQDALPKPPQRDALLDLLLPEAHAWVQVLWVALVVAGYVGTLYFGNDAQCKEIGLAIDKCQKQKRKIERFYLKMETLAKEKGDKVAKAEAKPKKKKKKKDDDEEDEDDDLTKYLEFKTDLKKRGGGCSPIRTANDDIDDNTADMVSEVSRNMQVAPSWLAQCSKDHRERAEKCITDISKIAEKLCLDLSINALKVMKDERAHTEVAIPVDPMNAPGGPASR